MAEQSAKRLCHQAVKSLQEMHHTLSGEDSELRTTWDEICVQVQGQESVFWDAYESAIQDVLAYPVSQLLEHERAALWLQTQEGQDWECQDEAGRRNDDPVSEHDIIQYLIRQHVLKQANAWSNPRIRAFLDRARRRD